MSLSDTRLVREIKDSNDDLFAMIIDPVVAELMHPGEADDITIGRIHNSSSSAHSGDRPGTIRVRITVSTEVLDLWLWYPGDGSTVAERRELFYSDLQDAIAESSFGWGQLRP